MLKLGGEKLNVKESLYKMEKNTNFIKQEIENNLTEKEKKQNKKIKEKNIELKLQEYFYKYFREHEKETTNKSILELYNVNKRLEIIIEISKNNAETMTFLNSVYEKNLQKISKIFFNNDKYKKEQEEKSKPDYSFEEMTSAMHNIFQEANKNRPKEKDKTKKHGLIAFLNMILK